MGWNLDFSGPYAVWRGESDSEPVFLPPCWALVPAENGARLAERILPMVGRANRAAVRFGGRLYEARTLKLCYCSVRDPRLLPAGVYRDVVGVFSVGIFPRNYLGDFNELPWR